MTDRGNIRLGFHVDRFMTWAIGAAEIAELQRMLKFRSYTWGRANRYMQVTSDLTIPASVVLDKVLEVHRLNYLFTVLWLSVAFGFISQSTDDHHVP